MTMGSNPCVADREGAKMAIHYACLYGHWACTQVMMEPRWVVQNGGTLKPLAQAIITDMHGQNRYIDARTCAGLTPLHMAAWAGHVEVAKILLQHGAYLNPKIVFSSPSTSSVLPGSTPTHLATRKNRIHVVKALLSSYVRPPPRHPLLRRTLLAVHPAFCTSTLARAPCLIAPACVSRVGCYTMSHTVRVCSWSATARRRRAATPPRTTRAPYRTTAATTPSCTPSRAATTPWPSCSTRAPPHHPLRRMFDHAFARRVGLGLA